MKEDFGWEWFIDVFHRKSGVNLRAYKRPQMERRINSFMRTQGAADYYSFIKLLDERPDIYRKFMDHLTINVSEFFRNKNQWDTLQAQILPKLMRQGRMLKSWSAGCSTGEEPYSLAMLLKESIPDRFEPIWATDLDEDALNKAKEGVYPEKTVSTVPFPMLSKYFVQRNGQYEVKQEIKNLVRFQKHDLIEDPFPVDFDLILCRNVVIYFTEETKEKLYKKFVNALRPGGVLFIGSTEQIFQARELGLRTVATFFYMKE